MNPNSPMMVLNKQSHDEGLVANLAFDDILSLIANRALLPTQTVTDVILPEDPLEEFRSNYYIRSSAWLTTSNTNLVKQVLQRIPEAKDVKLELTSSFTHKLIGKETKCLMNLFTALLKGDNGKGYIVTIPDDVHFSTGAVLDKRDDFPYLVTVYNFAKFSSPSKDFYLAVDLLKKQVVSHLQQIRSFPFDNRLLINTWVYDDRGLKEGYVPSFIDEKVAILKTTVMIRQVNYDDPIVSVEAVFSEDDVLTALITDLKLSVNPLLTFQKVNKILFSGLPFKFVSDLIKLSENLSTINGKGENNPVRLLGSDIYGIKEVKELTRTTIKKRMAANLDSNLFSEQHALSLIKVIFHYRSKVNNTFKDPRSKSTNKQKLTKKENNMANKLVISGSPRISEHMGADLINTIATGAVHDFLQRSKSPIKTKFEPVSKVAEQAIISIGLATVGEKRLQEVENLTGYDLCRNPSEWKITDRIQSLLKVRRKGPTPSYKVNTYILTNATGLAVMTVTVPSNIETINESANELLDSVAVANMTALAKLNFREQYKEHATLLIASLVKENLFKLQYVDFRPFDERRTDIIILNKSINNVHSTFDFVLGESSQFSQKKKQYFTGILEFGYINGFRYKTTKTTLKLINEPDFLERVVYCLVGISSRFIGKLIANCVLEIRSCSKINLQALLVDNGKTIFFSGMNVARRNVSTESEEFYARHYSVFASPFCFEAMAAMKYNGDRSLPMPKQPETTAEVISTVLWPQKTTTEVNDGLDIEEDKEILEIDLVTVEEPTTSQEETMQIQNQNEIVSEDTVTVDRQDVPVTIAEETSSPRNEDAALLHSPAMEVAYRERNKVFTAPASHVNEILAEALNEVEMCMRDLDADQKEKQHTYEITRRDLLLKRAGIVDALRRDEITKLHTALARREDEVSVLRARIESMQQPD